MEHAIFTTDTPGPWAVTSDDTHWLTINRANGRTTRIGPVHKPGGSRKNYYDKAIATAERKNREFMQKYGPFLK